MPINPEEASTIRVGQLAPAVWSMTDLLPHEVANILNSGSVQDLADLIKDYVGTASSLAFNPTTVNDGGNLPATTSSEWLLVGKGTFNNVGGLPAITTTEELNALTSNGTYWSLAVQIPINVELAGIVQTIRSGFTTSAPSENAVFDALSLKANAEDIPDISGKENTSNKQNNFDFDGTGTKYITVDALYSGIALKRSIAQIRAISGDLPNQHFYTYDKGKEGFWYIDNSDDFTPDNTGTVLVTADGKRIKRVVNGYTNVRWFGAKGDGVTDDKTAIEDAAASIHLSGGVLYMPSGTYHTLSGIFIDKSNFSIVGDAMPNTATDLHSLIDGTIIKGGLTIEGDNVTVKNIGVDFGIDYSDVYKSGAGGDGFVIHQADQTGLIHNINIENVVGLCRIGDNLDTNAAFHAVLIQSVKGGSAKNVKGVGGWYGVVMKVSDFNVNGVSSLENDTAGVYLKSNTYGSVSRVNINNVSVVNNTSRGYSGFLIQSSDANLNLVTASNINVAGGVFGLSIDGEGNSTVDGVSVSDVSVRNSTVGVSLTGPVYGLVLSNITVYSPKGEGLLSHNNTLNIQPINFTLNNLKVIPSSTTVNSLEIRDDVTKAVLSNIDVLSAGNTLDAGSVINITESTVISNYRGSLKRGGTQSEYQRIRGGDVTTSLANLTQKATLKIDTADPNQSIGIGYFNSGEVFMQAYNSSNNTSKKMYINPFGGVLNVNNLAGSVTEAVYVNSAGDLIKGGVVPTSGAYAPNVTASTNVTSATLSTASYTKIGNIVTGTVSINMQATSINLLSEITITAPVNRSGVVPNYYVGTGTYLTNNDFGAGNAFFSGSNVNTITLRFNSGLSVASSGNCVYTFQYDITK